MSASARAIVVLKFGGTSVAGRAGWETVAARAAASLGQDEVPVIVCSAAAGVSDALAGLLEAAARGAHAEHLERIERIHDALAGELGVDASIVAGELDALRTIAESVALIAGVSARLGEASLAQDARLIARVMASGELLSTALGAAFLRAQGVDVELFDARERLIVDAAASGTLRARYLSAARRPRRDDGWREALLSGKRAALTQGFIASDGAGDTVLLGRGGSDTSAALFAAELGAERLEIWTDVPGMFTADPRRVPSARLLRSLPWREAQEIATCGAKVLHPRCLEPARSAGVPIQIRWTERPEVEGTRIGLEAGCAPSPGVKAVIAKRDVSLLSVETVGMWQQRGFLAEVFATLARCGVSVDQVATSETSVTVTLDGAHALDAEALAELDAALGRLGRVERLTGCAAVSVVGSEIRGILHRIAPALELFEEHRVYLVTQAASDLNLTFVVDGSQADRLVRELHALFFGSGDLSDELGPRWDELGRRAPAERGGVGAPRAWWRARREELLSLVGDQGGALYALDLECAAARAAEIARLEGVSRVHYALKANPEPALLARLARAGVDFECVSLAEVERALAYADDPSRVLFTPNFAPLSEYVAALDLGVRVTLGECDPLERAPRAFRGRSIFARVDPGEGRGHHAHVKTGGARSKFGIEPGALARFAAAAAAAGARVVGLHVHVGSGVDQTTTWAENARTLGALARAHFPEATILDLGGGFAVPMRPGAPRLDLAAVSASLAEAAGELEGFEFWVEPGRYIVAEAGALLARVTQIKRKGSRTFVGLETGMNSLIRPSLYGAYHEIVNLTRDGAPIEIVADVVGPICESGDVLGYARALPRTEPGDVILIANAGAYGASMGSHYNLRVPAPQIALAPLPAHPAR